MHNKCAKFRNSGRVSEKERRIIMKYKKLMSTLLTACLLTGVMAGCVPGSGSGEASSTVQSEEVLADAEEADSLAAEENASADEVVVEDSYLPLCEPGSETLTILTYQNWHASAYYDSEEGLPVENEIEEITGVNIKWECVASGDYNTVAQTRLASGTELPDIIRIPNGTTGLAEYSSQGLLVNIKDYINETDTPNLWKLFQEQPIYEAQSTSPDGGIYGLPHAEFDINNYVLMWNIIRQDWLDNLGLSMPTTIDEFHDVLVAFRDQDPNGNGEKDEVPLGYQNDQMYGLYSFKEAFGFNNTDIWSVSDDGVVAFDLMDDKFLDCLTTLNQWYEEGLLSTTTDGSDADSLIAQDRLGAQTLSSTDNVIGKDDLVEATNPDGHYVFIPALTNDDYPDNEPTISKRQSFHDYYSVTIDCENPKLAVQWLDWVYASEESADLRYWGFENDTYTVNEEGQKVFTDKVVNGGSSAIDIMREIGAWPNFVGNESGEPFMAMYAGSYFDEAYNEFKDIMTDRVPIAIGTEEENDIYTEKWPDIETYVKENVVNFITGNRPLTEWEDYVQTLKDMGIDEVVAVKQAWYDRTQEAVE